MKLIILLVVIILRYVKGNFYKVENQEMSEKNVYKVIENVTIVNCRLRCNRDIRCQNIAFEKGMDKEGICSLFQYNETSQAYNETKIKTLQTTSDVVSLFNVCVEFWLNFMFCFCFCFFFFIYFFFYVCLFVCLFLFVLLLCDDLQEKHFNNERDFFLTYFLPSFLLSFLTYTTLHRSISA